MQNTSAPLGDRLEIHYAKGEIDVLVETARREPNELDASAKANLFYGLGCASLGAYPDAAAAFRRSLEWHPGDIAAKGALARVLTLMGDASGARGVILELAAAAQSDPFAADCLAEAYFQGGQAEDAFQTLSAASMRFGPHRFDARLAEAAVRTRRTEVSVSAARRARANFGLTPTVLNVAGPAALLARDDSWLRELTSVIKSLPADRAATVYDFWTGILMAGDYLNAARRAAEFAAECLPSSRRLRLLSDLRLATRDIGGAEAAALDAVSLDANDAGALTLLARCRVFHGDLVEAKRLLLQAVSADPGSAVAYDNLTQIDPIAMTDEMAAHLVRRLQDTQPGPDTRSKALLALARRDEAHGDHDLAFKRIIEAKQIIADAAIAGGRGYQPAKTDVAVNRLKAMFNSAPVSHQRGLTPKSIFIIGMPRSGTSLVEQILCSHSRVTGAGELPEMVNIMNEFGVVAEQAGASKSITAQGNDWIARYRAGLPPESADFDFVTDKHPLNFWSVGLIRSLFPSAPIINLVRSPVDVCLSILRVRFFGEYDFANEINSVAHYYAAYERMMAHWRSVFGDTMYDVNYEKLVAEPETETRKLLNYCGLDWEDACLAFHKTKRDVITHSAAQVREPLNKRGVERRQKYGDALKPLEDALARFGVQTR